MKKAKTLAAVVLAAAMAVAACVAFAACGGVDGTYTVTMSKNDYLAEKTVSDFYGRPDNVILQMVQAQMIDKFTVPDDNAYTVTLTLDEGNYTLRKQFIFLDNYKTQYGIDITFSGTYTEDEETEANDVVLAVPSQVYVAQYQHGPDAGSFMGDYKDKTYTTNNDESKIFFNRFDTLYVIESESCTAMTVVLDADGETFSV